MTKNLHYDALKNPLSIDDVKIEVGTEIINPTMVLDSSNITRKPKGKMKVRMVKSKVTNRKSRLEKATSHLYDLEDCSGPERTLNIDFGLYQMEEY